MGHITFVKCGVCVSIEINYENLALIKKLKKIENIEKFISGLYYCEDEIIDEEYGHDINHIFEYDNEKEINKIEFEKIIKKNNKHYNMLIYTYMFVCSKQYAKNISFRIIPHIYSDCLETPTEISNLYLKGKQLFLDNGISENMIKTGYTVYDTLF